MNKAKLKSYAPAARRDFIRAVTDRAHFYGLSEKEIIPVEVSGDVAIIGGRPFPRAVAAQRKKLEERVKREGFNQVMEAVAYTWFNRFLALRYMELHGYLEHGFRVLCNTGSSTVPEILDHATQLDLPGLNKQKVVELKLDGSKDAELYRLLLVAQCNALHAVMPFLFERIEDETELLLPDNLLHSDSLIRKLVTEIEAEDWQEVEIIGWLYQFYISEKKDQVIGKVVNSEDIPAATQLFTPNWIVKYMVQNSLGRQWLATYPHSPLKFKMKYYIEPAEQADEVKAQLAAITPDSLDPEKLTLLDPACGSGHILVEAYDVFKEIYLERGYISRDFPRLILEKNLFGLDIDERAAQMAGFALMMKARKDDRRILRTDNPVKLNVMAIQESGNITVDNIHWGEQTSAIRDLVDLFRQGKTYGSLIHVPEQLSAELPRIEESLKRLLTDGDLYASQAAHELIPLLEHSKLLARKYNCVVANPPYMGSGYFNGPLKKGLSAKYKTKRSDLYAIFLERAFDFVHSSGMVSMVTRQDWLFTRSYAELRRFLCENHTLETLMQLGAGAFEMMSGEVTQTAAYVLWNRRISGHRTFFKDCSEEKKNKETVFFTAKTYLRTFLEFPENLERPILYYLSDPELKALSRNDLLANNFLLREGIHTGDNSRFVRCWWEVSKGISKEDCLSVAELDSSGKKWVPYNKGGTTRRWYWGSDFVIRYDQNSRDEMASLTGHVRPSQDLYFKEGGTWSDVASKGFGVRYFPKGYLFDGAGPVVVTPHIFEALALMNSKPFVVLAQDVMPNLHFKCGTLQLMPYVFPSNSSRPYEIAQRAVELSQLNASTFEEQSCFNWPSLVVAKKHHEPLEDAFLELIERARMYNDEMMQLESENNLIFAKAYGLDELGNWLASSADAYIFNPELANECRSFISYIIGCMMGRYSLDQSGLVYANSGNVGFDHTKYPSFPADDDGIVPVMDMDWFPDDAASRFEEFLKVAWSPETLEENLKFVADILSPKNGETPRETIRRYISTQFFKDHLQTYKKRPIYWLFSSGKQRAFECLVYLHRYNEATLSRMRNEYVTPLQGKFSAQADYLGNEVNAATSTAERNRLQKQLDILRKKQVELASFDDLLRHYADQRISLDLDEGVKVNYGKFGNLLAEVKAVTGGSE